MNKMKELHHILLSMAAENERLRRDNRRLGSVIRKVDFPDGGNFEPIDVALQEYMKRNLQYQQSGDLQIGIIKEMLACYCEMNTLLRDGCQCGGV